MRSLAAATLLIAGLAVVPALPASAAPTLHCGDSITRSARLTADLACRGGAGITVQDGATLDLGGHTLRGPGRTVADSVAVVLNGGSVRNGTLTNWESGAYVYAGDATSVVSNVTVRGNGAAALSAQVDSRLSVRASTLTRNGWGVFGFGSDITLSASKVLDNGYGVQAINGRLTVDRTSLLRNTTGIETTRAPYTVTRSVVGGSTVGIDGDSTVGVVRNTTLSRNRTGIHISEPFPGTTGVGATLIGVTASDNTIAVEADTSTTVTGGSFTRNGTAITSSRLQDATLLQPVTTVTGATLTRNRDAITLRSDAVIGNVKAFRNAGIGIDAPYATDLGGNVAYGNGNEPQCTGVVCSSR